MRKKKWYLVSAVLTCAILMTACGQGKAMGETKQSTKKSTEKSEEKAGESKFKDRKNADLGLFKIYYPESWQYD